MGEVVRTNFCTVSRKISVIFLEFVHTHSAICGTCRLRIRSEYCLLSMANKDSFIHSKILRNQPSNVDVRS